MTKKFTPEMRIKALELYMQDTSVLKIAEFLSQEFGKEVSPQTIYQWARREKWEESRDKAREKALAQVSAEQSDEMTRIIKRHFDVYGKIINRGEEYLEHNPDFEKTGDAVRAMDIGVQGQRKVMEGLVNREVIWSLIEIVRSEVDDEEVLQRITAKTARLISSLSK